MAVAASCKGVRMGGTELQVPPTGSAAFLPLRNVGEQAGESPSGGPMEHLECFSFYWPFLAWAKGVQGRGETPPYRAGWSSVRRQEEFCSCDGLQGKGLLQKYIRMNYTL